MADAEWAMSEQKLRGSRIAVILTFAAVVVLIVWAAFAQLDEVTRGEGKVIPSRQVQVMQSLDGGIVSGDPGQGRPAGEDRPAPPQGVPDPLRVIPAGEPRSVHRPPRQVRPPQRGGQRQGLRAAARTGIKEAPDLVEQERAAYENKRMELDAAVGVARQQLSQRRQELNEVTAKREQATQSYSLTAKELEVTRPLAKTGAVSEVELLRLERDVARYRGERDAAGAQIPRIQAAISEAQRKIEEVELNLRNQARSELSETNAKLAALSAGSEGLADRVKQAEIRAPMNGTVKQLFANTVGGVVQPGKEIIEIVPSDDALLLEARVQPKDIAFLRPGQPALVKFTAYDFSIYGGLDATLEQIRRRHHHRRKRQRLLHRAGAHHPQHHWRRPDAHHPRHGGRGGHPHRQEIAPHLSDETRPAGQGQRPHRALKARTTPIMTTPEPLLLLTDDDLLAQRWQALAPAPLHARGIDGLDAWRAAGHRLVLADLRCARPARRRCGRARPGNATHRASSSWPPPRTPTTTRGWRCSTPAPAATATPTRPSTPCARPST